MSIVKSAAADGFIERLPRDVRFYLVHGADEGLTHERSRAIVHNLLDGDRDPLRLVRLDGDSVARDPGAVADEAHSISMFGGSRAIWIDAQGRDLLPALEPLFARPPLDCTVVVKAGMLKKEVALRSAFEKMPNGVSIECYSDEPGAIGTLIDAEMRAVGLSIAPDARHALLGLLGADRQTTRTEIEKLILYVRGKSRIDTDDVGAIVADASPSSLDDLIDHALLGDLPAFESSATRFFHDGGDPGSLMMRLIARLTLLHGLRLEMDQGRHFDAACRAVFIRLSAPAQRSLAKQAERWTSESIARLLPKARATSAWVRGEPRLSRVLATRFLWTIASRARGKADPHRVAG